MKQFMTLYRKDLKSISAPGLIIVALAVGVNFCYFLLSWKLNVSDWRPEQNMHNIIRGFDKAVYFMIPFILAYTLLLDRQTNVRYQNRFLPTNYTAILLSKLVAVMSICVLTVALDYWSDEILRNILRYMNRGETTLLYSRGGRSIIGMGFRGYQPSLFFAFRRFPYSLNRYIISCFFYCSLVGLSNSVMTAVKRWPVAVWAVTFGAGIAAIPGNLFPSLVYFSHFSGTDSVIALAFSTVYLTAGIFLYNKFSEV